MKPLITALAIAASLILITAAFQKPDHSDEQRRLCDAAQFAGVDADQYRATLCDSDFRATIRDIEKPRHG